MHTRAVAMVLATETDKTGGYGEDHGYGKNSNGTFSRYVV